ncbi:hypothetical protein BO78DRAFT_435217 [Aspergillus sclerotiicarbonarius CBS 121057]|uniref:Uncharacterized protein n=1 Tax=Aspergillus sclerotiicarbonarius (strain CBS 121057 / IBT 28362) TaxID=1448318 RepID=A0A319F8E3_ASPSB|nr:hypothetical protein BO78DRAFT_435217 [Aspergillus sclerotiicarbonarius CBS 121057]
MSLPPPPIPLPHFLQTLQTATTQTPREYKKIHGCSVRWEIDGPKGIQDTQSLQTILTLLNGPPADELIIEATDNEPALTFVIALSKYLYECKGSDSDARNLLILHYPSYNDDDKSSSSIHENEDGGFLDDDTQAEQHSMGINQHLLTYLKDPLFIGEDSNLDILLIFDSKWVHKQTELPFDPDPDPHRIIEVLAATNTTTLIHQLATEIKRRQDQGYEYLEFADLMGVIHNNNTPVELDSTHAVLVGVSSVTLSLQPPHPHPNSHSINPSYLPATYKSLFSVNISTHLTTEQLIDIRVLTASLLPFAAVTLEAAYPTSTSTSNESDQSTTLLFSSAWSVFSKLKGIEGYALLMEGVGGKVPLEFDSI